MVRACELSGVRRLDSTMPDAASDVARATPAALIGAVELPAMLARCCCYCTGPFSRLRCAVADSVRCVLTFALRLSPASTAHSAHTTLLLGAEKQNTTQHRTED